MSDLELELRAKLSAAKAEIERLRALVPRWGGSETRNRFGQELAQHYHMLLDDLYPFVEAEVAAEREACARIADANERPMDGNFHETDAERIARAIRARTT